MEVCHCVVTAPASIPMSPALDCFLEKGAGSPSLRIVMEQKKWVGVGRGKFNYTLLIRSFSANPMAETLI